MDQRRTADVSVPVDVRAAPDAEFLAAIERRFPVEAEIGRVLSRKMAGRTGPGYSAIPLQELIEGTRALIRSNIGDDFVLANARWLQGGASKLQIAFDLEWNGPDGGARRTTAMVLRMEPPAAIVETSRRREFEILRLMRGVAPVPPCYWIDAEGTYLPHPALVYGFAEGRTVPGAPGRPAAGFPPRGSMSGAACLFGTLSVRA